MPTPGKPYTLVDIPAPPAPPDPGWSIFVGASLAAALIVGAVALYFILRYRRSAKSQSRRTLARLRHQVVHGTIEPRTAVVRVAICLRTGLGLPNLTSHTAAPDTHPPRSQRWALFVDKLSRALYAAESASQAELRFLIEEATYWLRDH
jgi:hypothetical protein